MNKGIKKKWSTARILKTIKKINVKDNDVLVFQVKTDRHGLPDMPLDDLYDFYKIINKTLTEKTNTNAFAFFVTDKIPLYSVESIETLERNIELLKEVMDKCRKY